MKKILSVLGNIFSFGLLRLALARHAAKKRASSHSTELQVSKDIPFKLEVLLKALGGIDNLKGVHATYTNVRFELLERSLCDAAALKRIGAKGVMFAHSSVTCLFGDFSVTIEKELKTMLRQTGGSCINQSNEPSESQ